MFFKKAKQIKALEQELNNPKRWKVGDVFMLGDTKYITVTTTMQIPKDTFDKIREQEYLPNLSVDLEKE